MVKVSIIMPAYNAAKIIEESIQSVLQQTYSNWELLVIDDCSTDKTKDIVEVYCKNDDRIIYLVNEKNSGPAASRNNGIRKAKGEWIAFLDSDDIWDKSKLEKQINQVTANEDISISYTASGFMNYEGNRYSYVMPAEEKVDYETLLHRNILSCSSLMIKAELMKSLPMPKGLINEDYYCWLKFLKDGYLGYGINEPLLIYRLSPNSDSSNRIKAARKCFNTYRAVGCSWLRAAWLVVRYIFYSVKKRNKIKGSEIC